MLGHKNNARMIDNRLGRKLTITINSLGSKLIKGIHHTHHHHVEHHEPKEVLIFLERR